MCVCVLLMWSLSCVSDEACRHSSLQIVDVESCLCDFDHFVD